MEFVLVTLLTLHLVLCFTFFVFLRKKKMALALSPIVFFIPFVGFLTIGSIYLYGKIERNIKEYEKDEVFLKMGKMVHINQIDQEKEKNIVPVEEALIVNDHQVQRQMVMEIAKRNPKKYLSELKKALLASDTETAHYAASSILELKREYDKELIKAQRLYEENRSSRVARNVYVRALDKILIADLNLEAINANYTNIIVNLLVEDITESEKATEESFVLLIEYLIKLNKHEEALEWMNKYHELYSRSDNMLRNQMKVAYKLKDNELFNKAIEEIEKADFTVTQKTLDMVDFWQNKAET